MKLKEKLATEYQPDGICVEEMHLGCLTRDAYLAGFEKAREMAAKRSYHFCKGQIAGMAALFKEEIKNIGEEEVKE